MCVLAMQWTKRENRETHMQRQDALKKEIKEWVCGYDDGYGDSTQHTRGVSPHWSVIVIL